MESLQNIEHYLRLNLLNIKGATPALQAVVLKIASLTYEKNVEGILKYFKSELERLVNNSTIAKESFDSLFPIDGSETDVTKWDVTLASTVLLNCCTLDRKRKDLTRVLLQELKLNGNENDVPAYLKAKASELNEKKGELITEKQYKELQDAENVTDLRADLIICLLLVCGSLIGRDESYDICKSILVEEIEIDFNNKTEVQSYLNTKKGIIENLKKDLKLFDNEFKQLYGDKSSNDINLLNKNLLVLFVLNACERLKPASQVEIKKMRKLRNKMIAHKGKAELKSGEFLPVWTDLHGAITILLKVEDIDLDFENRVKPFKEGDLDIENAIDILKKHYREESNDYQILKRTVGDFEGRITETIEEYQKTMQDLLKNSNSKVQELTSVMASRVRKGTIADFRKEMEISCLDIKIVVKGNDTKAVEKAHQAIEKAMKGPTGVEREKRKAMNKILDIIERDGSTVIEVRKGSVIARIRCRHLEGVSKLLIYVDSEEWINDFNEVTTDLGQELGQQFAVETNIQEESMQMLYNDIKQKDSEYEDILPLSFEHEQTHEDEKAFEMETDFESTSNADLERIAYLEDRIRTKVTQVEQMRDQLIELNTEHEKLKVTLKVHEDKDKFDQEKRQQDMKDVIKCIREERDEQLRETKKVFRETKIRYSDEKRQAKEELQTQNRTIEELKHTISIQAIDAAKKDDYIKQTMSEMEEIRNTIKDRERELQDQNIKYSDEENQVQEEMQTQNRTIEELKQKISIQAIDAAKKDDYIKQTMSEMEEIRNTIKDRERELQDQNIKTNELERSLNEAKDTEKNTSESTFHNYNQYLQQQCQIKDETNKRLQDKYQNISQQYGSLEEERSTLVLRLSKIAGAKLTAGNANIADLSDENRPTKLAEKFSELYDNEWTDAFEFICERFNEEEVGVAYMLDMLQFAYELCNETSTCHLASMEESATTIYHTARWHTSAANRMKSNERVMVTASPEEEHVTFIVKNEVLLTDEFKKQLNDMKKVIGFNLTELVQQEITTVMCKRFDISTDTTNVVLKYIRKCIELCWYMGLQNPPAHMMFEVPSHDLKFDPNIYKPYTKTGKHIAYVVWPPLFLHKDGSMLSKGVAQGKK